MNIPPQRTGLTLIASIILLTLVFTGCTAHKQRDAKLDFPDMHIEVDPSGTLPPRFWDSYSLFNEANKLFEQERFPESRTQYEKLIAIYPDDDLAPLSLFNSALCLEREVRFVEAIQTYGRLEKRYPDKIGRIQLSFRYAYCFEHLNRWEEAILVLSIIAVHPDATNIQRIQAQARIAIATFYAGREDQAQKKLREAMAKYENLRKRNIKIDNHFYAKACFTLGEFYFNRYTEVKLEGAMAQLDQDLENKSTLFILARAQYLKSIRTYDREYMFASLFRIGLGYEHFYFAFLNAPLPDDLEPGENEQYVKALQEKVAPFFLKSREAYGRNLQLGKRLSEKNRWLEKTRERLAFLERWQKENQ